MKQGARILNKILEKIKINSIQKDDDVYPRNLGLV